MVHRWQPAFDPQAAQPKDNLKTHAVHIALLPQGTLGAVIYFSGNRWDGTNHNTGNVDHTALLDYQSRIATRPGSPTGPGGLAPNKYLDVFCSGHALLADGRLLVGGGTSIMGITDPSNPHTGHWGGLRESFAFDPAAIPSWQALSLMNASPLPGANGKGGGRWYPSLVTLADGSVLALCGHPRVYPQNYDEANESQYPPTEDDPRHDNNSPDRYFPCSNSWALLSPGGLGEGFLHDYAVFYPRVHVLPDGKLLIVQPLYTTPANGSIDPTGTWAGKSIVYDVDGQTITAGFDGPQLIESDYRNPGYAAQPTTSVLLPLLPENEYHVDVLLCGGVKTLRTSFMPGAEASAHWTETTPRQAFFNQGGTMVVPPRTNAVAILLPTGDVFVSGGTNAWKNLPPNDPTFDQLFAVLAPEIYNHTTGTWTALTDAPASVPRGYHSSALLMLDGRVLTAGSEKNNIFGAASAEYRMEVFEPDYISVPNRVTITHTPPCAAYSETFTVKYQLGAGTAFTTISRVAITRFGSCTHGFDYDQRYVGLTFTETAPGVLSVTAPPNGGVAPPGYYMLWLLDSGGLPCLQAGTLRIGSQRLHVDFDRSVFSIDDVRFNENPKTHVATYTRTVFAVFDGFIPNEVLGLTPVATVSGTGVSASLSASGAIANPALELPGSPQLIQRTVFAFDLTFTGEAAFAGMTQSDDVRVLTVTVTAGDWTATGNIELVLEPSPFMLDGQPPWLSEDIRVFQVTQATAGHWLPGHVWSGPTDYISALIAALNANPALGETMFATLPTDEAQAALSLLPTTDGTPNGPKIYSFALARVRLDSATVPAKAVRVMFRLFRTMRPSLIYDMDTIYRRAVSGTDAIALLGVEGSDIISIPFFAHDRVTPAQNMASQPDPANLIDIPAGSTEQVRFFGCWLDINQPNDKRFPSNPGTATSFGGIPAGNLRSIQELIAGFHQCLVTEVHYKLDAASPDLPRPGDTPSTSDKLSQRNLALLGAANPGNAATRTVQQNFEIKSTQIIDVGPKIVAAATRGGQGIDALALWWGNLPRESEAEIYLPGIAATDVLALLPPAHAPLWYQVDGNTLRCSTLGDVAFLPLPPSVQGQALAGLITLRLPAGVRHGQVFHCLGQQFSRAQRIVGAFEMRVMIDADHAKLLTGDRDQIAILKHIHSVTSSSDRWYLVLTRMIAQLSDRVRGFGGNPGSIPPSPWGAGPHAPVPVGVGSGEHHHPHHHHHEPVRFIGEAIVPEGVQVDIDIRLRVKRTE
ncbi:glyoxal oxidase [Nostoc sp. 'Peltigera membranacea cyanobiont' 232]|uniref:glyoxal oxidase n=1 Tax=Nostoc sp. 'Peltigera membranacea cyanobiont' 232 TaxID=2014531 RepID=UPI000B95843D|nr:glyoxal oxidase [Nostoc sp. 'Peltigera membranacea cyanobiont' 232]OYE01200.1 hypothetical protein CDG79_30970 [Nostoc sp. 'Peltigera membranacea cyanobiont' 232]